MCGIAGCCLRQGIVPKAELQKMATSLAHRGPDGEGFFTFLNMGLAHRRLSIIDLEGGRQPLEVKGEKAPLAAVVNGEVYNYKQLQKELADSGVRLMTGSDSEPILHLIQREGAAAWQKLEGMYAAAIVDGRSGDLWVGVDPFGIKPLYYVENAKGFAFASEPRALIAGGWVSAEVNVSALGALLNCHHSFGEEILFAGIKRMLPGERFRVHEGRIVERWRQLPELVGARAPALAEEIGLDEALAAFESKFMAAVERHLQSDVPYGVLLSGGLDSSSVVLMMAKLGVPIKAYTAKFDKPGDEDTAAAALAARVGAKHVTVTYGAEQFWEGLPKLAFVMDDLVTDYSSLPLLSLMARARQDVTVLLSGEGGDELLAGYGNYRLHPLKAWWKSFRQGDATPYASYFEDKALVGYPEKIVPWDTAGMTRMQERQGKDIAEWLPHDLLLRLDRVSMAYGIEGRVPFLDDRFAPWAFSLPDRLKVGMPDGGKKPLGKWIVRQWLARQGHADMAFERKKGFSVPVGDYLLQRADWVKALWEGSPLVGSLLKKGSAGAILKQAKGGKAANLAFSLTLLALWHRVHVEGVQD